MGWVWGGFADEAVWVYKVFGVGGVVYGVKSLQRRGSLGGSAV